MWIRRCLRGLAGVAAARGQSERAARLWGAAEALRDSMRPDTPTDLQPLEECDLAAARCALGEAAFAAAWAKGRALPLEQVVADALEN
jgi:hypothetical protein